MIVVDTSALMAIVLGEAGSNVCIETLLGDDRALVSAGTLAEALIVAERRGVLEEMERLVDGLGLEIVPVSLDGARRVAAAYRRWGKGVDPAGLNFGDCFAYALARENGCQLLYIGRDFAKTDIAEAAGGR